MGCNIAFTIIEGVVIMKRKILTLLICMLLIASTVLAPVSALAATSKILIVNVDGARLRSGSRLQKIVTSLKKGTRVVYSGKHKGSMYLVRASNGKKGYIYRRYLSAYGAASTKNIYAVTTKTNLYRRASSRSKRVTRLAKGTTVIVYSSKGNWRYVRTLDGKAGYVRKNCLKRA